MDPLGYWLLRLAKCIHATLYTLLNDTQVVQT